MSRTGSAGQEISLKPFWTIVRFFPSMADAFDKAWNVVKWRVPVVGAGAPWMGEQGQTMFAGQPIGAYAKNRTLGSADTLRGSSRLNIEEIMGSALGMEPDQFTEENRSLEDWEEQKIMDQVAQTGMHEATHIGMTPALEEAMKPGSQENPNDWFRYQEYGAQAGTYPGDPYSSILAFQDHPVQHGDTHVPPTHENDLHNFITEITDDDEYMNALDTKREKYFREDPNRPLLRPRTPLVGSRLESDTQQLIGEYVGSRARANAARLGGREGGAI